MVQYSSCAGRKRRDFRANPSPETPKPLNYGVVPRRIKGFRVQGLGPTESRQGLEVWYHSRSIRSPKASTLGTFAGISTMVGSRNPETLNSEISESLNAFIKPALADAVLSIFCSCCRLSRVYPRSFCVFGSLFATLMFGALGPLRFRGNGCKQPTASSALRGPETQDPPKE